jgi:hypothetical protein
VAVLGRELCPALDAPLPILGRCREGDVISHWNIDRIDPAALMSCTTGQPDGICGRTRRRAYNSGRLAGTRSKPSAAAARRKERSKAANAAQLSSACRTASALLLFTPFLAAWSIWVGTAISARSSDPRVAGQLSLLASLPLVAVTTLIALDLIHATLGLALGGAAVLLVLDTVGWRMTSAAFDRERLITSTR